MRADRRSRRTGRLAGPPPTRRRAAPKRPRTCREPVRVSPAHLSPESENIRGYTSAVNCPFSPVLLFSCLLFHLRPTRRPRGRVPSAASPGPSGKGAGVLADSHRRRGGVGPALGHRANGGRQPPVKVVGVWPVVYMPHAGRNHQRPQVGPVSGFVGSNQKGHLPCRGRGAVVGGAHADDFSISVATGDKGGQGRREFSCFPRSATTSPPQPWDNHSSRFFGTPARAGGALRSIIAFLQFLLLLALTGLLQTLKWRWKNGGFGV